MGAVLYALAIRFRRQRVWALTIVLPALLVLSALFFRGELLGRSPAERSGVMALELLVHFLPAVAAILLLTAVDDGESLLRVRPVAPWRILLARWSGAAVLIGACQLLLAGWLSLLLALSGGGPPAAVHRSPARRLYLSPETRWHDAASIERPWPTGPPAPGWVDAVEGAAEWAFEFEGLAPGVRQRARVWPWIGRILSEEGEKGGRPRRELARADRVRAIVSFSPSSGAPAAAAPERELRLELLDRSPVEIEIPPGAVPPGGRLRIALRPDREAEGGPGMVEALRWGTAFFWFDPAGAGNPLEARDLRIVDREIPFPLLAFRAALLALPKTLLVAALAGAARAILSIGVSIGLTVSIYLFATGLPFLREVIDTLSSESALTLLESAGEHAHHGAARATGFEHGLRAYLDFWLAVLPDFSRFQGLEYLRRAEVPPWGEISSGLASGLAGSAAILLFAAILLTVRGARR